ncbi:MAG: hypothetical protein EOL87_15500 [Spartobacteria bacterium]|nr:hypothetical protein [Spartobacteria bacterium]
MPREYKKSMSQKLRMDGGDYARAGWYFITMGPDYHKHYFGRIEAGVMHVNDLGRLVEQCWRDIPSHYGHIELGAWQVMPNHFHGLVHVCKSGIKGVGEVINMFKGSVTREWRRAQGAYNGVSRHGGKERMGRIWAPNYYDVICLNAEELEVRERYIRANPRRWSLRDVPRGQLRSSRYMGNKGLLEMPLERRALRISAFPDEMQNATRWGCEQANHWVQQFCGRQA